MSQICLGFIFGIALLATLPAAAVTSSEKSKVSLMALDVTLDGDPRPDVGRALSDAFSAAMLKKGTYRLFSSETSRPARPLQPKAGELSLAASPAAASKSAPDVDFWFTFNLVGEANRYALSVKKIDAKTQEVLSAQELTATGQLEKVMALAPQALEKLEVRKRVAPFPMTQSPSEVRAAQPATRSTTSTPSKPSHRSPGTYMGVPPEYADIDLSNVPKALVYRRVGSIETTNQPWKFAVVKPLDGKGLGVSETVQVLWDDNSKTYSSLKVGSWDTGRAIADYGHNPSHKALFRGDAVYGWAEPLW
jgi:hypothetical protein